MNTLLEVICVSQMANGEMMQWYVQKQMVDIGGMGTIFFVVMGG